MELRGNNLYRNGSIISLDNGELLLRRDKLRIDNSIKGKYETIIEGDRLDILAYRHYNKQVEDSSKFWWVLADANDITDPLDLSDWIGKEMFIPDIITVLLLIQ